MISQRQSAFVDPYSKPQSTAGNSYLLPTDPNTKPRMASEDLVGAGGGSIRPPYPGLGNNGALAAQQANRPPGFALNRPSMTYEEYYGRPPQYTPSKPGLQAAQRHFGVSPRQRPRAFDYSSNLDRLRAAQAGRMNRASMAQMVNNFMVGPRVGRGGRMPVADSYNARRASVFWDRMNQYRQGAKPGMGSYNRQYITPITNPGGGI